MKSTISAHPGPLVAWGDNSAGEATVPTGLFKQVACGTAHSIALRSDGIAIAWGSNTNGQLNAGNRAAIYVAAGPASSVIIKPDGTLVGSGIGGAVPDGTFVAVDLGNLHGVGITESGAAVAWGSNTYGQCDVPSGLESGVTAVAAGYAHSLALKNGIVYAWGRNENGVNPTFQCNVPAGLSNVIAISAQTDTSAALTADGTVWCWGDGFCYENIGGGWVHEPKAYTSIGAVGIAATACGCFSYTAQGAVRAHNPEWVDVALTVPGGLLAHAVCASQVAWTGHVIAIIGETKFTADVVSGDFPLAVQFTDQSTTFPTAWDWDFGDGSDHATTQHPLHVYEAPGTYTVTLVVQTPVGAQTVTKENYITVTAPLPVAAFAPSEMAGNVPFSVTFNNQSTVTSPVAYRWDFGDGSTSTEESPTHVYTRGGSFVVTLVVTDVGGVSHAVYTVFAGDDHPIGVFGQTVDGPHPRDIAATTVAALTSACAALRADGAVTCWGSDDYGKLDVPEGLVAIDIVGGSSHFVALTAEGRVAAWGYNGYGQCNVPESLQGHARAIAAGGSHSLAITDEGVVVAWGRNYNGQLGVAGMPAIAIGCGDEHSLVVAPSGTVQARGENWGGQLNVPAGLVDVRAVDGGYTFSAALKTDGTVVCWGANYSGQCEIPSGLVATEIACGGYGTLARAVDGGLVRWGSISGGTVTDVTTIAATWQTAIASGLAPPIAAGTYDPPIARAPVTVTHTDLSQFGPTEWLWEFGDGATSTERDPIHVYQDPGSYWVTITATNAHGESKRTVGIVTCVTPGNTLAWITPQTVDSDPDVFPIVAPYSLIGDYIDIAIAEYTVVALRSDGTIDQVNIASHSGVLSSPPEGLTDVVAVAAGSYHALALKSDGSVVAWGWYSEGRADVPEGLVATAIACCSDAFVALTPGGTVVAWGDNGGGVCDVPRDLTNVVAISGGDYHILALKDDGTVVAWGDNSMCQCEVGSVANATAIAAGENHSAVIADGVVWLTDRWTCEFGMESVQGITDAIAIAAGEHVTIVLHADGRVTQVGGALYAS